MRIRNWPLLTLAIFLSLANLAEARFYFLETEVRALDTSQKATIKSVLLDLNVAAAPIAERHLDADLLHELELENPQGAVVGKDDRERVGPNTLAVSPSIGQVLIYIGSERFVCTGTLVSPRHVMTAGHCLYTEEGWAERVLFIPGRNGPDIDSGIYVGKKAILLKGWSEYKDDDYDIGMIKLTEDLQAELMPIEAQDKRFFQSTQAFYTVGYPGDRPDGTQWIASSERHRPYRLNQLLHYMDTARGQSGAPIFYLDVPSQEYRIVGLHTGSFGQVNGGIRFNSIVLESILRWVSQE